MAFTTRNEVYQALQQGKGVYAPFRLAFPASAGTAGAAASGFFSARMCLNSLGTTFPSTFKTMMTPSPTSPMRLVAAYGSTEANSLYPTWLARFYVIGTVNLAAVSASALTHDAATFPVTRTSLGTASSPVSMIPMLWITTATTTTAPIFSFTYVNQDGSTVVGAKTMTMPSAATTVSSGYILRLEDGDSGVRDVTAVNVTTAGATGAATLFGVEPIAPVVLVSQHYLSAHDALAGAYAYRDLNAAVATSGSATSYLGIFSSSTTSSSIESHISMLAVVDP